MVYVYAKQSQISKYVGKKLSVEEIEETLKDMGMDIKGISEDKDPELKVEITAEKTDMVSCVGIARAIKYYRGIAKDLPKYDVAKAKHKVIVDKSALKSRPRTVCAILRDVNMTQELLDEMIEIQEKIHASFGRNRKKASIGIYPCDEFEFPVTFSAEKPEDIIFRPLEADTEMNALEILSGHDKGKEFAHLLKDLDFYPVFRDKNGKVLSMPPIINSHETGRVDLHHKDLFIEISGHNLTYLDNLLKVMISTFIEMGAKAESVTVEYSDRDNYELNLKSYEDIISLEYINKLIGLDLSASDVKRLANKVMMNVTKVDGDKLTIEVPAYRSDIWHDSDIADDIARAYGYNNIVPRFPNISTVGETLPFSDFRERVSQTLVSMGFLEIYTYMLTSTETQFKKMNLNEEEFEYVRLIDSEDQGLNMIRIMNLPESLSSLLINRKNKYPQKIFENGFTIQPDEKVDTKARNEAHLCVCIADPKSNYTMIKGVFDTLMKLNEIEFEIKDESLPYMIEGRCGSVYVKGQRVGFIGEVHPSVLTNFGMLVPVCCFELDLDKIWNLNK